MGEGLRAACIIANHKHTGTRKPSRAEDVQVQAVCLPAKLLLEQHRT